mmetsp:Transcript_27243/g.82740  ORF Transcript_27243/g.82740 Transcript_27243/m.82740 type:complete len:286 (-) Transcript_27243:783-1640(-)
MRAPDAAVFAQIATCALVAHARGLPRTFQEGDRSVPVRLVVLKGLRVANGGDDIQRDVHGRVKGVVIGRGAREWARDPDGAASVHNGAGEELDGGGQPLPRAVLGLGAASTNLLLKDTIGACDDGVRRVRHRERIEPDAEPPFGGPREGDRCRAFLHIQLEAKGDTHIRGDLAKALFPRRACRRRVRHVELGDNGICRRVPHDGTTAWQRRVGDAQVCNATVVQLQRSDRIEARLGSVDVLCGQAGAGGLAPKVVGNDLGRGPSCATNTIDGGVTAVSTIAGAFE